MPGICSGFSFAGSPTRKRYAGSGTPPPPVAARTADSTFPSTIACDMYRDSSDGISMKNVSLVDSMRI